MKSRIIEKHQLGDGGASVWIQIDGGHIAVVECPAELLEAPTITEHRTIEGAYDQMANILAEDLTS